jgi:hypothetical protein
MLTSIREASIRLGCCEPTARRILAADVVMLGDRKKYPLATVLRIIERGTYRSDFALRGSPRPSSVTSSNAVHVNPRNSTSALLFS